MLNLLLITKQYPNVKNSSNKREERHDGQAMNGKSVTKSVTCGDCQRYQMGDSIPCVVSSWTTSFYKVALKRFNDGPQEHAKSYYRHGCNGSPNQILEKMVSVQSSDVAMKS